MRSPNGSCNSKRKRNNNLYDMKKNPLLLNTLMIAIICLPLLYLAITYNSLPANVSLHFNSKLEADRTGDKSELWIPVLVLAGVAIFVFFLLNNLHRFDPKRKDEDGNAGKDEHGNPEFRLV